MSRPDIPFGTAITVRGFAGQTTPSGVYVSFPGEPGHAHVAHVRHADIVTHAPPPEPKPPDLTSDDVLAWGADKFGCYLLPSSIAPDP